MHCFGCRRRRRGSSLAPSCTAVFTQLSLEHCWGLSAGQEAKAQLKSGTIKHGYLHQTLQYISPNFPLQHQEAEARLKPGTIKHCALTVLRDAGARGMPIDDIMAAVAAAGLRQWDANSKRVVQFVCPPFRPPAELHPAGSVRHPSRTSLSIKA